MSPRVEFIRMRIFLTSVSQMRSLLVKGMDTTDSGCIWRCPAESGWSYVLVPAHVGGSKPMARGDILWHQGPSCQCWHCSVQCPMVYWADLKVKKGLLGVFFFLGGGGSMAWAELSPVLQEAVLKGSSTSFPSSLGTNSFLFQKASAKW